MPDFSRPDDMRRKLLSRLQATGLADQPGTLLYSGLSTLQPGPVYFLGYNPGGDAAAESESISSRLQNRKDEINEYLDTSWSPAGRARSSGTAPLQRRVCHFLQGLGLNPRTVCASNVIFVRSRAITNLENPDALALKCWPVHIDLLDIVRPELIFTMGNDAFNFVLSRSDTTASEVMFPSGHGDWQCRATTVRLDGRKMALVSAPHFGRYAVDRHPDVIRWVREKYLNGKVIQ